MREGEEGFRGLGLGSHMTRADVDERLPKAIEIAGFGRLDQQVYVHGSAERVGKGIMGVVGVEFSCPPSSIEVLRFTHALVGEVETVATIDVLHVPEQGDAKLINRIAMGDAALWVATHQE